MFSDSGPIEGLVHAVLSPLALCCWVFRFNNIVVDTGNASCVVDVRWEKKTNDHCCHKRARLTLGSLLSVFPIDSFFINSPGIMSRHIIAQVWSELDDNPLLVQRFFTMVVVSGRNPRTSLPHAALPQNGEPFIMRSRGLQQSSREPRMLSPVDCATGRLSSSSWRLCGRLGRWKIHMWCWCHVFSTSLQRKGF